MPIESSGGLSAHPRRHFHLTLKSASCINQVERSFAELTRKKIRQGTVHRVRQLQIAIRGYVAEHNKQARPFKWPAAASGIIRKVRRRKHAFVTGY